MNIYTNGSNHMTKMTTMPIFGNPPSKLVSEYDQETPQSQTADKPMVPRGRATQQIRDTRKTN